MIKKIVRIKKKWFHDLLGFYEAYMDDFLFTMISIVNSCFWEKYLNNISTHKKNFGTTI